MDTSLKNINLTDSAVNGAKKDKKSGESTKNATINQQIAVQESAANKSTANESTTASTSTKNEQAPNHNSQASNSSARNVDPKETTSNDELNLAGDGTGTD